MKDNYDVVIVGGGIAGSSLAACLARNGVDVLVLEKTIEYVDRVRGEAMLPWGVAELKTIGLYDVLKGVGGKDSPAWLAYDAAVPQAIPIPVDTLPGHVPLNIGHPAACAALAEAAEAAGATFVRGVGGVALHDEGVAFGESGDRTLVRARLVVGADGRNSSIREQAGIAIHHQDPTHMLTGLLVQPTEPLPDHDVLAASDDLAFLYFLQPHGRVRVYAAPSIDNRSRFTGREGASNVLGALDVDWLPTGSAIARGEPVGPCATYPGDDMWTDEPFAKNVLLIGDAAGYNNPLLGQGLSLAMRDVRIVGDLLLGNEHWTPETLRPYAEERVERMRRVRVNANVMAAVFTDYSPGARERRVAAQIRRVADPVLLQGLLSAFTGPETAPAEAFADDILDRVFATD